MVGVSKTCPHCGQTFERTKESTWKWERKKYCNKKCSSAAYRISIYEVGRWRMR